MARVASPVASVPGADSEAKLALVEFLLTSIDVQESARRSVDWLVAHAPVREAAVLVQEGVSNEMLLVAENAGLRAELAASKSSRADLVAAAKKRAPRRRSSSEG